MKYALKILLAGIGAVTIMYLAHLLEPIRQLELLVFLIIVNDIRREFK